MGHSIVLAVLAALALAAPAAADTQIAELERPSSVSAHDGRLAWSTWDASAGA